MTLKLLGHRHDCGMQMGRACTCSYGRRNADPDLFAPAAGGHAPEPAARNSDPGTSHAAAAQARESAATQRDRILAYLRTHGPKTADELDAGLALRVTSAGRRLPELEERGFVEPTDEIRPTSNGRGARVWRATRS